jgi:hypothetical protein
MRGFLLRAAPVCVAVFTIGCFFTRETTHTEGAPRTPTHAYWRQANAALAQKPAGGDMRALVQLVRTQSETLRALPSEGVDAELVAAVDEVIKSEERVIEIAEMFGSDATRLKTAQGMAVVFADANRQASEAKSRLKAMRSLLNARYGGGFAPAG